MTTLPLVALGVALVLAGTPRGSARARVDPCAPLLLDLAAAALRAGCALAVALEVAAPVSSGELRREVERVTTLLRLGADHDEAWRAVAARSPLEPVARAARRSGASGSRIAPALERRARELREQAAAAAEARAHRAGVLVLLPLALCFLPAFVCLGVLPTVVGLAVPALRAGR